jgi:hypothetical protein
MWRKGVEKMFQKDSFGTTEAQVKLATLHGKHAFPVGGNIVEVNNVLEKVLFALQIHAAAPKYVLTRALYDNGDKVSLQSARFVVRPAVRDELAVADLKKTFQINAGEDFFDKFISEMAQWFDLYQYHKQLQVNVNELNTVVDELIAENEIPFAIQFSFGSGLIDASDDHAVVGLSADVIANLGNLSLFDENMESRRNGYKAKIVETLKECTKPYDIVKVKNLVTKDLGLYSRRALNKLMRQFVSRKVEFVRVGTGYVETETVFAIVDKVAVTEKELAEIDATNALVIDNADASSKEKEAGKTKIVVVYRVSPFTKEEGTPADVKLADVI